MAKPTLFPRGIAPLRQAPVRPGHGQPPEGMWIHRIFLIPAAKSADPAKGMNRLWKSTQALFGGTMPGLSPALLIIILVATGCSGREVCGIDSGFGKFGRQADTRRCSGENFADVGFRPPSALKILTEP